ncbi:MAG: hypothetical protein U0572_08860 [Phycisphaerales bacterium]
MEAYDKLVKLVHEVEDDVKKAEGGNKAAGTRVRKAMQEIRATAQALRAAILEARDAGAAPPAKAAPAKPPVPPPAKK